MSPWPSLRVTHFAVGLLLLSAGRPPHARAEGPREEGQGPPRSVSVEELARRLDRLEQQNARLAEENKDLRQRLESITERSERPEKDSVPSPAMPLPLPLPNPSPPVALAAPNEYWSRPRAAEGPSSRFLVGEYDDERGAFVLVRTRDDQVMPFELRLDVFTQARYFGFRRSKDFWVDSTGARLPVRDYSSFEVTRNFFQFSGYGLDPRLQFNAIIFSSTAINDTVYLGWLNYRFNKAFDLRVGNWLVPGTREWIESFRYTLGADRLMATTFFRPNISPGIWAQGEPLPGLNYVAMVANSLNRFTQGVERVGTAGAFGGTVWWEPLADFGPGPSDIEQHETLSPRIGTNVAFSRESNQGLSTTALGNPEDTILRLSNGTPLFRRGALGPGVELRATSVQLWTIDAAMKYRGLGVSGEYFMRWLNNFQAVGPEPMRRSIFDQGALLQAGYFLVPQRIEPFARTSIVSGPFGGGYEWGGGVNWYPQGLRTWRMTAEVLRVQNSPAQNLLTGYRAGESGTLFQVQWFTDF